MSVVQEQSTISVGMAQAAVARPGSTLTTVLGSCIGVLVYSTRVRLGALAHVVLPNSRGHAPCPAKYADTAIRHLIDLIQREDTTAKRFAAKIMGGASMFNTSGPLQVGDENVRAVLEQLKLNDITLVAQCVGGTKGRRVKIDCQQWQATIDCAGEPSRTI